MNTTVYTETLSYPENCAGAFMTSHFVALKQEISVKEALTAIRSVASCAESIYTCYVTDEDSHLEGVITLKELLLSPYETAVQEIMDQHVIKAEATDDREEIVAVFDKYDFLSLPVVDPDNRLVGIITVDDIVDALNKETTEDMELMAALSPSEKPYLETNVFTLAKHRILWLLLLMVSSMLTGGILAHYEEAFAVVPLLVTFIPMLMDTGGNAGSQSSTLIIRGMTVGEILPSDILRVIWKELRVSILCGGVLALINFIRLMFLYPDSFLICLTVSLSILFTVILSKCIGCILPIAAKKIGLDPALMAAPLITTIVDVCSLALYFQIATVLLHLA